MSNTYEHNMYTQARKNIVRTWIIILVFTAVVAGIGYGLATYLGNPYIIAIAIVVALVSNTASYFFSERIALSTSRAVPADFSVPEEKLLIQTVETIAITAGLPTPGIYVIHDSAPNAFATGRNPEHSSVAFTTGLLEILEPHELEGVVAHELSHIKNRDILVGTIVIIMLGFIVLLSEIFIRGQFFNSRQSDSGPGGGALILVMVAVAILSPIVGKLIQTAVSRKREYLADASGALLTRYPEGLAHALAKISNHAQPMKHASQAISHLCIANPFGGGTALQALSKQMFATHPPVAKRIEALLGSGASSDLLNTKTETKTSDTV